MFVYGKNVAKETLRSNKTVKKAYLSKEFNDKEIISLLEKKHINIEYLTKNEIMKMDKNNNQGIILSVPDFEYCSLFSIIDCKKPFIVILDHLSLHGSKPLSHGQKAHSFDHVGCKYRFDGINLPYRKYALHQR